MNRNALVILLWGLVILLLGMAALAFNLGLLAPYEGLIIYVLAGVLAGVGVVSIIFALSGSERWMFFIPGFALMAMGGVVYLTTLQMVAPRWLGALFLGGVAAGFFVAFLMNRIERWWALLQSNIIVVIALVALGFGVLPDAMLGALLFGGLGVSFFLVWLLGGNRRRLAWAALLGALLIAAAFVLVGAVTGTTSMLVNLWPVLFIIAGALVIGWVFTGRASPPAVPQAAPLVPVAPPPAQPADAAETARIVWPGGSTSQPASDAPSSAIPMGAPAHTGAQPPVTSAAGEVLPDDLPAFDPENPGATLDALLDASQKKPV